MSTQATVNRLRQCRCGADVNSFFTTQLVASTPRFNIFVATCYQCGDGVAFSMPLWSTQEAVGKKAETEWNAMQDSILRLTGGEN